jgi:hypothetical protein
MQSDTQIEAVQVPKQERASLAEAKAAVSEQLSLARSRLRSVGFQVGDEMGSSREGQKGVSDGGAASSGAAQVAASALSQDEQRRFLESMRPR